MVGRVKAHTQNARAENERTENARTENKEHENTERISTSVGAAFNERWSEFQRVLQRISVGGGARSTNYIDPFFKQINLICEVCSYLQERTPVGEGTNFRNKNWRMSLNAQAQEHHRQARKNIGRQHL